MTNKYAIGLSSDDKFEMRHVELLSDAMFVCWGLATRQAVEKEIDAYSLQEWGTDDITGYGVCPTKENGTEWPQVFPILKE